MTREEQETLNVYRNLGLEAEHAQQILDKNGPLTREHLDLEPDLLIWNDEREQKFEADAKALLKQMKENPNSPMG